MIINAMPAGCGYCGILAGQILFVLYILNSYWPELLLLLFDIYKRERMQEWYDNNVSVRSGRRGISERYRLRTSQGMK